MYAAGMYYTRIDSIFKRIIGDLWFQIGLCDGTIVQWHDTDRMQQSPGIGWFVFAIASVVSIFFLIISMQRLDVPLLNYFLNICIFVLTVVESTS